MHTGIAAIAGTPPVHASTVHARQRCRAVTRRVHTRRGRRDDGCRGPLCIVVQQQVRGCGTCAGQVTGVWHTLARSRESENDGNSSSQIAVCTRIRRRPVPSSTTTPARLVPETIPASGPNSATPSPTMPRVAAHSSDDVTSATVAVGCSCSSRATAPAT